MKRLIILLTLSVSMIGIAQYSGVTQSAKQVNRNTSEINTAPIGILTLANLTLTSPDFKTNGPIPTALTCTGKNKAPLLEWDGVARTVQEFALICEDPDAPTAQPFVHWVVYKIPGATRKIGMQLGRGMKLTDGTCQGINDFKKIGYDGPCPPPGKPHQYVFTLYALDKPITLKPGATKTELKEAIRKQSNVTQTAQLIGIYQRAK